MAANHMPKELRGGPLGPRKNGRDPFKDDLYKVVMEGVHKALKEEEIEYGFDLSSRSRMFFSVFDGDQQRTFWVRINETA